jgi:hypothetical protein
MRNKKLAIALRSALFLAITGIIAWLLGQPMIFPSLGPTAYVLAFYYSFHSQICTTVRIV